jgi:hypothetical protein
VADSGALPLGGTTDDEVGAGTSADVELRPFGTVTSSNEKDTARLMKLTTIVKRRLSGGGADSTW